MSYVTVDAPRLDAANVPRTLVAATSPLAYVRFHGRNAATWNSRGGGAAQRFDYLYDRDRARRVGRAAARARRAPPTALRPLQHQQHQTDGVAQAPAGAELLRGLLRDRVRPGRLSGSHRSLRPAASVAAMRVLSVVHGALSARSSSARSSAAGHELVEWQIASAGRARRRRRGGPRARRPPERRRGGETLARATSTSCCAAGSRPGRRCSASASARRRSPTPSAPASPRLRAAGGASPRSTLTAAGAGDPVLGVLPPRFDALFANRYAFELPRFGVELVTAPRGPQAFRIGARLGRAVPPRGARGAGAELVAGATRTPCRVRSRARARARRRDRGLAPARTELCRAFLAAAAA